mgnify:CR=1 FL=1
MNYQNLLVHGIQNIDCSNHVSIKYKVEVFDSFLHRVG